MYQLRQIRALTYKSIWLGQTSTANIAGTHCTDANVYNAIHTKQIDAPLRFCFQRWHASVVCTLASLLAHSCLELHFVGRSSKWIGYLTGAGGSRLWSWSSDNRVFQFESVPRNGYFAGAGSESRLWESGILPEPRSGNRIWSWFRNRRLPVPGSFKEWNRGSDSQFGIG